MLRQLLHGDELSSEVDAHEYWHAPLPLLSPLLDLCIEYAFMPVEAEPEVHDMCAQLADMDMLYYCDEQHTGRLMNAYVNISYGDVLHVCVDLPDALC